LPSSWVPAFDRFDTALGRPVTVARSHGDRLAAERVLADPADVFLLRMPELLAHPVGGVPGGRKQVSL
jgi:hypothetical protein